MYVLLWSNTKTLQMHLDTIDKNDEYRVRQIYANRSIKFYIKFQWTNTKKAIDLIAPHCLRCDKFHAAKKSLKLNCNHLVVTKITQKWNTCNLEAKLPYVYIYIVYAYGNKWNCLFGEMLSYSLKKSSVCVCARVWMNIIWILVLLHCYEISLLSSLTMNGERGGRRM